MSAALLTLVAFLEARFAEDAADAQHAGGRYSWEGIAAFVTDDYWDKDLEASERHIARHSPARVLAEVAAKRRIVELHHPLAYLVCSVCQFDTGEECVPEMYPCPTVRALASVYADHSDFNPEWRAREPRGILETGRASVPPPILSRD